MRRITPCHRPRARLAAAAAALAGLALCLAGGARASAQVRIVAAHIDQSSKKGHYKIDFAYPLIAGESSAGAAGFNAASATLARKEVAAFMSTEELPSPDPALGDLPYTDTATYHVLDDSPRLVSVRFDAAEYTGGAHSMNESFILNYDVTRGGTLKLSDVFSHHAAYLPLLSHWCFRSLRKTNAEWYQPDDGGTDQLTDGTAPTADNYNIWNITPQGIAITFVPYQVGPYAEGQSVVVVPYSYLSGALSPRFAALVGK